MANCERHNQRVGHGWLFIHFTRTEPQNLRRDEGEDHVDGVAEEPQWFDGQNVGAPVCFFLPRVFRPHGGGAPQQGDG